ncbi:MAG TPA: hypothetical protein VG106_01970 [Vicinamibacterales bacterium]|nr:hypothetical protein [Vicinamibacterales bacterium]
MRAVLVALLSSLALVGCGGTDWDDGWEAADGESIDEAIVSTGTGCPDGEVVLLHLGWPLGTPELRGPARQYIRDPNGTIVTGSEPFDPTANLPSSARFSGYRRGDVELWLASDADEFVYVVFDDHTERWPRMVESFGCG